MGKILSENKRDLISRAERFLSRPLSSDELKAVFGFADAVVTFYLESCNDSEIVDLIFSVYGKGSPVKLFINLATTNDAVLKDLQKIKEFLKPKERKILEHFDVEAEIISFRQWLFNLLNSDSVPATINAFYFGMNENENGYSLYLIGTNNFDRDNSEWACNADWVPECRVAPLYQLSNIINKMKGLKTQPWIIAQAIAIIVIKTVFERNIDQIRQLIGKNKLHVATGFDEGDLYYINTPMYSDD